MTARLWMLGIITILSMATANAEPLADMDGDLLRDTFSGRNGSGFGEKRLRQELSGDLAGRLIERCKSDRNLRSFLTGFPPYMPAGREKDELILYVLREADVWHVDVDVNERSSTSKETQMQIQFFVTQCLGGEFALAPDDDGLLLLSKAIVDRARRLEVATVFEEVMKIPNERRHQDDPEMAASVRALRKVLAASHNAKVGTENSTGLKTPSDGAERGSDRRPAKSAVEKPPVGESESKNRWTQVGLWGLLIAGGVAFSVFAARKRVM